MTLIELLTAMMVSTILIGTAFATFYTATSAWEKAKRRTEMLRLLEGAAEVITRHFRAVEAPFMEINPTFIALNDGDEYGDYDDVCFLSSANARFPRELALGDLCEIEFYIETGERGAFEDEQMTAQLSPGLWMRIDPTPDDDVETGGYLVLLGEQITSFNVTFIDGQEQLDEWFYDYEAPEAVEFTLVVTDPEERENPMSLTRLVVIPKAELINEQTTGEMSLSGTSGTSTEPGMDTAGETGGGESAPGESSSGER